MIKKVLIANRGEIAVRIIRALREMGILSVAVYSTADAGALHVQLADQAVCIGEAPAGESYLNMENLISATMVSGADAIHPGYGFLSENYRFAQLCEKCRIVFIGPPSDVIRKMGNKQKARETMMEAGIPVIPGSPAPVKDLPEALQEAERIGYPVMVKAVLGGGGKGIRAARSREELEGAFLSARAEALASFGDGSVYLERLLEHPRHVEVQILADARGHVIHLGERDCSIQRKNQKLIEEAPCAAISPQLREKLGQAAVRAAQAAGYVNAGTVEFLVMPDGAFYFMEMNTRIQVEHPVTEWVTGLDLVKAQICVAMGEPLPVCQSEVSLCGHAIECRINAEDPAQDFRPCSGTIRNLYLPGGCGVRVDTALYSGCGISPFYDSMLVKLIVRGRDRREAVAKLRSALGEVVIEGIRTNTDFLYGVISHPDFLEGNADSTLIERIMEESHESEAGI